MTLFRNKSMATLSSADSSTSWKQGRAPAGGLFRNKSMATLSSADSSTSWKLGPRRSEGHERRVVLKRNDSMKQLNKVVSKTWRGYQRATNWMYELEWKKQRKLAFDPVPMKMGLSGLDPTTDCACAGFPCPCVK